MPRTAEDSRGRLSETKITDFSNIIAQRMRMKSCAERAERNIGASQVIS